MKRLSTLTLSLRKLFRDEAEGLGKEQSVVVVLLGGGGQFFVSPVFYVNFLSFPYFTMRS